MDDEIILIIMAGIIFFYVAVLCVVAMNSKLDQEDEARNA